ncbi:growth-blocking peptide 3 [Haematobia irritans]|uniref:growth-blocking peptide 3 n=1 Tax=Haematobia irritans TaxID=7368 RepID=UPI003F500A6D
MSKSYLLVILFASLLMAIAKCDSTTTETTSESEEETKFQEGYIIANNLPPLEEGCSFVFKCRRKLQNAEQPKPCLQTCVDVLECNNQKRSIRKGFYCLTFNEELVGQEHQEAINKAKKGGKVAMIDFPCQPGYLPDSRGRCREVW